MPPPTPTPADLAALHLEALYILDDDGRIVRANADVAAPQFHLFRMPEGNRWHIHVDCPAELRSSLDHALAAEPLVPRVPALQYRPPRYHVLSWLVAGAAGAGAAGAGTVYRGPAFHFPDVIPLQPGAVAVEVVDDVSGLVADPALAWIHDLTEAQRPFAVARDDRGVVVAVCHSSRSTPRAAEAGVETAEASRQRGYGVAVVAAWAEAVRAGARVPLYSTEWDNGAARGVAQRLGLRCYGEDLHIG